MKLAENCFLFDKMSVAVDVNTNNRPQFGKYGGQKMWCPFIIQLDWNVRRYFIESVSPFSLSHLDFRWRSACDVVNKLSTSGLLCDILIEYIYILSKSFGSSDWLEYRTWVNWLKDFVYSFWAPKDANCTHARYAAATATTTTTNHQAETINSQQSIKG